MFELFSSTTLEAVKSGLAILGLILVIPGIIQCFFGYRVLKLYITIIGFLVGLLAFSIVGTLAAGSLGAGLLIGLLGGLLLAFLAFKLHKLAVCLINGANAMLAMAIMGIVVCTGDRLSQLDLSNLEESAADILVVGLVAAVIVAVLTAILYRPVVILSTAFQGGVFLGCGLCMMLFALDMILAAFLLCFVAGAAFQFYNTRAEGRAAKEAKKAKKQQLQQDPKAWAQAKANRRLFALGLPFSCAATFLNFIFGLPAVILFCVVAFLGLDIFTYWKAKRTYPKQMASVTLGYFLTHPFKKFVTYDESQPAAGSDGSVGERPEGR